MGDLDLAEMLEIHLFQCLAGAVGQRDRASRASRGRGLGGYHLNFDLRGCEWLGRG